MTLPKISCLTVTAGRLRLLKGAIRCYLDQTYPNRELVVVTAGDATYRRAIRRHLARLDRPDIRLVTVDDPDTVLGRLRNVSLDHAEGDIVCQWDDDDLYYPERLQRQYDAMEAQDARASFLSDHLQFFVQERELYWVDWTIGDTLNGTDRLVPQSLMVYRDSRLRYPEEGPDCRVGEDCAIRTQIRSLMPIAELADHGYLYAYRYHGRNTLGRDHHGNVAAFGMRDQASLEPLADRLAAAVSYYRLPMPYLVKVREGAAVLVAHR